MKDSYKLILFALFFLVCFSYASFLQAQSEENKNRNELISAAREIMLAARYCALITLDETGRPNARTMDPFEPEHHMVVWLGTNSRSRKVRLS